jgi:alpha-tubulin suppressor-like RCC1 family protein
VSQKFPGGFITKSPPAVVGPVDGEGGSAPGVWTLDQAMALNKQGLWPKPLVVGQLWAWGNDSAGALGQNQPFSSRSSPVQIGALNTWKRIAAGNQFGLAIKTDGTLWSWGYNSLGQLGLGDAISRSSPVQVGALTDWAKIAGGDTHSLAIKTGGTLWAWGRNNYGQLGQDNITNRNSPVQIGAATDWAQIGAGGRTSLAVKTNGTLWAWGGNGSGQLGLNNNANRSSPVQVGALTNWSSVAIGNTATAAVKTDGTLWTWGRGDVGGVLGHNNTINRSSPVQVGALTNWSQVSVGQYNCMSVKTDGTLWGWGQNTTDGRLGLNDLINRSSPVQVGSQTNWARVSTAFNHVVALKTNGTLWVWGDNTQGKLGLGDATETVEFYDPALGYNVYTYYNNNRSSPTQLGSLTTWKALAPKLNAFSMAIKSS